MRVGLAVGDRPFACAERLVRALVDDGRHECAVIDRAGADRGFDVVHELGASRSVAWRTPYARVMTLDDPVAALHDVRSPDVVRTRLALRRAVRRCEQVITFSEHAKREVMRLFGVREERISITPPAADGRFVPGDAAAAFAELRSRYDLPGDRFLLHVDDGARSNVQAALSAFSRMRALAPDVRLVVVTGRDSGMAAVAPDSQARVDVVNGAGDDDLVLLYRAALALVNTSLQVAFALRPLEAMQSGCPLIASQAGSVQEVTGDAALACAPEDVDGVAGEMLRVSRDDALRGGLRRAGLARAAQFTWARTVDETVAAYERALAVRAGRGGAMGLRRAA